MFHCAILSRYANAIEFDIIYIHGRLVNEMKRTKMNTDCIYSIKTWFLFDICLALSFTSTSIECALCQRLIYSWLSKYISTLIGWIWQSNFITFLIIEPHWMRFTAYYGRKSSANTACCCTTNVHLSQQQQKSSQLIHPQIVFCSFVCLLEIITAWLFQSL